MDRDEEKDLYIKARIKNAYIPEKIDNLFNNSINLVENKGGDYIGENNQKTNKKQVIVKRVVAMVACAVVALGGGNIYATTHGYDNVFFMIKEWINPETSATGKDEILSDRDITISYKQIQIAENLQVIIKKLQVKDGVAKLFIQVEETGDVDSTVIPLTYKIYNEKNKLLCEQDSCKEAVNEKVYTEEIAIKNYNDEKILNLEINKSNGNKITTIKIDLDERTLEVQGEKEELNKISEIELKEFLGYEASMEAIYFDTCTDIEGTKVLAVQEFLRYNDLIKDYKLNRKDFYAVVESTLAEKVAKEVFAENIGTMKKEGLYSTYTENGVKYYGMKFASDISLGGTCIDISNISYCDGIYTTTFTYVHLPDVPDYDINDCTIYQNTVNFKYDENNEYSKFLIVSKNEATIIKQAEVKEEGAIEDEVVLVPEVSEEKTNNETPNKDNSASNSQTSNSENSNTSTNMSNVNNYASTMSWTDYWAPGLRIKYPTIFNLEEIGGYNRGNMQGEVTTKITGVATGINPDTKEIINSNLTIKIYEPIITNEDVSKYIYADNGTEYSHYTTNSGLVWYEKDYINDKGEAVPYSYTYIEEFADGNHAIYKIEFESDIMENYKVINIINWLLGSTQVTSY